MNEERRKILEMLAEGKITADEAERLISALERQEAPPAGEAPRKSPRYLRVLVDEEKDGEGGPTHVNVKVPLQLLRAGVRLATLIPPQALETVNDELRSKGFPIDLSKLKADDIDELVEQLRDITVDVDDSGSRTKVRVFCE